MVAYGATQEAAGDQHRFQHIRRAADLQQCLMCQGRLQLLWIVWIVKQC